jgi:hypothetical protein
LTLFSETGMGRELRNDGSRSRCRFSNKGTFVYNPRTWAVLAVVMLPLSGRAQDQNPAPASGPVNVSTFRSIVPVGSESTVIYTTCDGMPRLDTPVQAVESSDGGGPPQAGHHTDWPEVWGTVGVPIIITGSRMAPNGVPFKPLFGLDLDFNIGLLSQKELYLFAENKFWAQRAAPGVTNPSQGKWDFSKREYDLLLGVAWTYFDAFELRVSTYALNNLNRGESLSSPIGFKDGILLESRYYFSNADIYDVGRLSFLSIGYYPAKGLVAGDGQEFHPGLFARAYLTYDLAPIRSYVYFDGQFTAEHVKARLLELDLGLAARPFGRLPNLEFRIGYDVIGDVQVDSTRNLLYGAIRILY